MPEAPGYSITMHADSLGTFLFPDGEAWKNDRIVDRLPQTTTNGQVSLDAPGVYVEHIKSCGEP